MLRKPVCLNRLYLSCFLLFFTFDRSKGDLQQLDGHFFSQFQDNSEFYVILFSKYSYFSMDFGFTLFSCYHWRVAMIHCTQLTPIHRRHDLTSVTFHSRRIPCWTWHRVKSNISIRCSQKTCLNWASQSRNLVSVLCVIILVHVVILLTTEEYYFDNQYYIL